MHDKDENPVEGLLFLNSVRMGLIGGNNDYRLVAIMDKAADTQNQRALSQEPPTTSNRSRRQHMLPSLTRP